MVKNWVWNKIEAAICCECNVNQKKWNAFKTFIEEFEPFIYAFKNIFYFY